MPGQHSRFLPQHAAAAAVIGHCHNRRDVAAVALQTTQQGGQAGAATDGHDVGPAVQAAFGPQGIHQHRVLVRCEGLLDRAETAASPQQQSHADDHHHGPVISRGSTVVIVLRNQLRVSRIQ